MLWIRHANAILEAIGFLVLLPLTHFILESKRKGDPVFYAIIPILMWSALFFTMISTGYSLIQEPGSPVTPRTFANTGLVIVVLTCAGVILVRLKKERKHHDRAATRRSRIARRRRRRGSRAVTPEVRIHQRQQPDPR